MSNGHVFKISDLGPHTGNCGPKIEIEIRLVCTHNPEKLDTSRINRQEFSHVLWMYPVPTAIRSMEQNRIIHT